MVTLACLAAPLSAWAQTNFDRPGGDYMSSPIPSGDPADCALACERDRRCRAWSFNYPTDPAIGAVCWLKNTVPARVQDNCCVSGVRGAGVVVGGEGVVHALAAVVMQRDLHRGRVADHEGDIDAGHARAVLPRGHDRACVRADEPVRSVHRERVPAVLSRRVPDVRRGSAYVWGKLRCFDTRFSWGCWPRVR